MRTRYTVSAALLSIAAASFGQLNILTQFDPSNTGGTCGIAYNAPDGEIMVIGCSASVIDRYAEDGTFLSSADVVGEGANDVDIDMSPADLVMNGTFVAQGQLLLVNGESGVAEIYAIDEVTNEVIDTLPTGFGASHVVGGSYHPQRGTFFLVQDKVPGGFQANRIAEVDVTTGDTLQTFSTMPEFQVDYGDLDISPVSGHLFVVSSDESTIAEFTPDGAFVTEHVLPSGVSSLSGIALDNDLQGAWVCSTSGVVFKLGNFPVGTFDQVAAGSFGLFPNPADDELCIRADATYSGPVTVVDAAGRVVVNAQLNGSIARIHIGALTTGVYMVRFNAGSMVARFVKN
jgi:DNA-binding beta-propeller fold protein YncE